MTELATPAASYKLIDFSGKTHRALLSRFMAFASL